MMDRKVTYPKMTLVMGLAIGAGGGIATGICAKARVEWVRAEGFLLWHRILR